MKFKQRVDIQRIGFLLAFLAMAALSLLGGCAQMAKVPPTGQIGPSGSAGAGEAGRAYFEERPSLSMEELSASASSLSQRAQALSQDAEQLREKAKEPIPLASLPAEPGPLPSLAAPALDTASTLRVQAQALSQDAEQLREKVTIPPPVVGPTGPEAKGPTVVEVPAALVPEKEAEYFPSLQELGKKKPKEKSPFEDIFFAFNESLLGEEAREILQKNAKWLRSHGPAQILIEGHCDERGTVEYNLALGERRAQTAKDFLLNLGVSSDRISIISYGKEKPFALGHDEEAWAQNRRAHFLLRSP
ncbi:MAG: peptidoglycan-associated lipoprotein Pal [bacterium]